MARDHPPVAAAQSHTPVPAPHSIADGDINEEEPHTEHLSASIAEPIKDSNDEPLFPFTYVCIRQ